MSGTADENVRKGSLTNLPAPKYSLEMFGDIGFWIQSFRKQPSLGACPTSLYPCDSVPAFQVRLRHIENKRQETRTLGTASQQGSAFSVPHSESCELLPSPGSRAPSHISLCDDVRNACPPTRLGALCRSDTQHRVWHRAAGACRRLPPRRRSMAVALGAHAFVRPLPY